MREKVMREKVCLVIVALFMSFHVDAQNKALKFGEDGKFKIVQFTDIHYKSGNPNSQVALDRMNEVLDAEKPDLVVYTGDLIYSAPAGSGIRTVVEPASRRGIPFAVVLGNHDDEFDLKRHELIEVIKDMPGNYTSTTAGLSGVTNFILTVKGAKEDKDEAVLYFFDTHAYSTIKEVKGYDWLKFDQISWYISNSKSFTGKNEGTSLPALAFFHIPLPEYNQAASDEDAKLVGSRMEKACAPALNTGMFTAMLENKDVMATFVGHDHNNDYAVLQKGILLCYGRFTGGNTVYNDLPEGNGARVIELEEGKRSFKTYIRIKDGKTLYHINYPESFRKNVIEK